MARVDIDGLMRTLLIIDDQPSVLHTLDYVFSLRGYRTLLASSGAAGLELAANESFDAALVDLHMPGMDGLSVCRQLRERAIAAPGDARVWIMTAAHTSVMVTKAAEAGAIDLLKKPFDCEAFLQAVEDYCGGTRPLPPMTPPSAAPSVDEHESHR